MVTYHLFIWNKFKVKNYLKKINDLLSNLIQGKWSQRDQNSLSLTILYSLQREKLISCNFS